MSIDSKTAIICLTKNGKDLALKLKNYLPDAHVYALEKISDKNTISIKCKFSDFVGEVFNKYEHLIFIMATGIVVRAIAPNIVDKTLDPSVLVIDEKGKNVISLLSGHIGGANEMTLKISSFLNANPVITTSTDINEKSSLDMICKSLNGFIYDFKDSVKKVNSALVNGLRVGIYLDREYNIDDRGFIKIDDLSKIDDTDILVYISNKKDIEIYDKKYDEKIIRLIPKDLVLSIGCRRGTSFNDINDAFIDFCIQNNIHQKSISCIASVDVKADEIGIMELSKSLNVPFKIVDREDIKKVEHMFDKSEFVKKSVGVYSVAEPVAFILSDELLIKKTKYKGITFGLGRILL